MVGGFIRRAAMTAAVFGLVWGVAAGEAGAQQPQQVKAKLGAINVEPLAKLDNAYGMEYLPDGRLLVTEKPGRLRIFENGKLSEPVQGVPPVEYRGQGGLLDVAVSPQFAQDKTIYLSFTEPAEQQPPDAKAEGDPRFGTFLDLKDTTLKGCAVARAKLEGNALSDVKVIWRQTPKTIGRGHYAGRMLFMPDGKLLITSGERQRFDPSQDPASNVGKVVRINPDGSIPTDNPHVKKPGASGDVWTSGNRNPLGIAMHPQTKQVWVNEMGPKGGDELNLIEPGKNYGWPTVASKATHYGDQPIPEHSTHPEFTPPAVAWTPVISPSGMAFYSGKQFPGWQNSALIGGLSSKALIRVTFEGQQAQEAERLDMGRRIRDVIESPDGAVLVLTDGKDGELLRLTPAGSAASR